MKSIIEEVSHLIDLCMVNNFICAMHDILSNYERLNELMELVQESGCDLPLTVRIHGS